MKTTISVYEQALSDLCKKARVKSPLDLIGKRVAFSFFGQDNKEAKVFTKISQVNFVDNSLFSVFLESGNTSSVFNLSYHADTGWQFVSIEKGVKKTAALVEHLIFELKWWQF